MRPLPLLAAALMAAALPAPARPQEGGPDDPDVGPWKKALSPPTHTVLVERKVMVPMPDGARLASDVYRPEAEGRYPTILVRTPYGRESEAGRADVFVPRGYALVLQDVRGRLDSEGDWVPFVHEAKDGSDAIDWIARQPWSDGNVGMIGASYVGMVQGYAASTGNPHLKAIVPIVAPPDPDQNIPYEGGVFLMGSAWWALLVEAMEGGEYPEPDWTNGLRRLPLGDLDKAFGIRDTFLDDWVAHPPTDAAYWDPQRYQNRFAAMDLAALHISGWFDEDVCGAYQNFTGLRRRAKTERARNSQFLLLGPWGHGVNSTHEFGDADFGPRAVIDLDAVTVRFFDRYLKGTDNGMDRDAPVRVFVTGENRWRAEKDWPLPGTVPTRVYLSSGGHATKRDGDGRLGPVPADGPADSFRYDPMNPPPNPTDFLHFSRASASLDYSGAEDSEGVLDYTSPPLAGPVELTGEFSASLSVSTTAEDTDFYVEVFVVAPSGRMSYLARGIQRLRYRLGSSKDAPVKPGEVVTVEVDCWANGRRLEQGDRLRVQVSSSSFPIAARNLNTLEPQLTAKDAVVATNTVHHDAARPSFIVLPVVPRDGAPGLRFED